jgi:hypothetical protein
MNRVIKERYERRSWKRGGREDEEDEQKRRDAL